MRWNWQLPEWPQFSYNPETLRLNENEFLHGSGLLLGAFASLNEGDIDQIRVDLLSDEALETSRIEGELLDRQSLQSSVRRQFGLPTDSRKVSPAEQGIAQVMVDVYLNFEEALTSEKLCVWQQLLMKRRFGLRDVGRYRTTAEPMQIVSGPVHAPKVHFEAVPSQNVAKEMTEFLGWFNDSRHQVPALARAAISHIYFESIHPFEDGNGRIGRAIAELALSQSLGKPVLLALSKTISARKKSYYAQLEQASRTLEISAWVEFFADTVLEAQQQAARQVSFIVEKARFFDRYRGRINERQEKVLRRLFAAGPDGFEGGLSSGNYQSITQASPATATRDLEGLVEIGALAKTGEKRGTRYRLHLPDKSGRASAPDDKPTRP